MTARRFSSTYWLLVTSFILSCLLISPAMASVTDLLNAASSGEQEATVSKESDEQQDSEKSPDTPPPEPSANPVQPILEQEPEQLLESELPTPESADAPQQIQILRHSLASRRAALEDSRRRLAHAQTLLERLDNEYRSFELRLEKAGLNLTVDYARLLRQRLDRLKSQTIAVELTDGISARLSAAREAQLRLEEYGAVNDGEIQEGELRVRQDLITQLHEAVTEHIDVLNEYYNTVIELRERFVAYQELLQQRLFWLPSTERVGLETFKDFYQGARWILSEFRLQPLREALGNSFAERGIRILVVLAALLFLLARRRVLRQKLVDCGQDVGNVGRDRIATTLTAAGLSLMLALPGVLLFSLVALLLKEGNSFFSALSYGFSSAAFVTLLLEALRSVARRGGLGERHFHWNAPLLAAIRRQIPILIAVLAPVVIVLPTMEIQQGAPFDDSLGRLLFTITSVALAWFAWRVTNAVRQAAPDRRFLKGAQVVAVATPLALALAALEGYYYTAVQLQGLMFISICWVAFAILLYYMGLRGLSVRERRMTLKRLREQRIAERKMAEAREAAENSGEGVPIALDMPEMDLEDISQQSKALVRILAVTLAVYVLWGFWADVIPALQIFDNITLWSISGDAEGETAVAITLGDLLLGLLVGVGTVLAARNLPGTLEVMVLSRVNLEPGSGYAITTLVTYTIVFFGVVSALAVIGVQWSELQWLIAALGVGLGFGLQEIVANFVSGIILLFERPIRVGDTVTIGGTTGTVSRIRIRATTLVDWDRKEQIIPNKTFVTQDLTNWTLTDPITRVIIHVVAAYGSDVDKVRDLLQNVAEKNERVLKDPAPAVFCVGLGERGINFEVRVFVQDLLDFMPLSHELHSAVTRAFQEADMEIPFPQQDIHIRTVPIPKSAS